jgi:heme/copper-type cytochrome/quinol oxidase subunit 1
MKALSRLAAIAASAGGVLASAGAAWAGLGQPTPWQMDLQDVRKERAAANPWGPGATTLEWTLPSPPPFHQYETLPLIR